MKRKAILLTVLLCVTPYVAEASDIPECPYGLNADLNVSTGVTTYWCTTEPPVIVTVPRVVREALNTSTQIPYVFNNAPQTQENITPNSRIVETSTSVVETQTVIVAQVSTSIVETKTTTVDYSKTDWVNLDWTTFDWEDFLKWLTAYIEDLLAVKP